MSAACLVVALCFSAAQSHAANPDPASAELLPAARAWAASLPGAGPQATEFVPMDPRTAATACASGWRFDLPFADPRAVRARCERPQAQVFLRALQALRATDNRTAGAAPAPPASPPQRTQAVSPSSASVSTAAPGAPPTSTAATAGAGHATPSAAAEVARPVVVLRVDRRRGERLDPATVEATRLDEPPRRGLGAPVEDPATLEHMEMVRDKQAGQVLYTHDIQPALLVRRGQLIAVSMQGVPGLRITARLEALQDGRHGQSVRLRNPESGRIVSAVVTGPGEARLP